MAAAIHPGEHLAEILEDLGISRYRLARTVRARPLRAAPVRPPDRRAARRPCWKAIPSTPVSGSVRCSNERICGGEPDGPAVATRVAKPVPSSARCTDSWCICPPTARPHRGSFRSLQPVRETKKMNLTSYDHGHIFWR